MSIQQEIGAYENTVFAAFFPEAHIFNAVRAKLPDSLMEIGCQSVHPSDVVPGGNFGAFTTGRTAKAAVALGAPGPSSATARSAAILWPLRKEAGTPDRAAVSKTLHKQVTSAVAAGLNVLYCVGETVEEQPRKYDVIRDQLEYATRWD